MFLYCNAVYGFISCAVLFISLSLIPRVPCLKSDFYCHFRTSVQGDQRFQVELLESVASLIHFLIFQFCL